MQLSPGEVFAVARQIADPYDSATYYVRAEIRDARTDALLATLDLEDKGNQRFRKDWKVVTDPSGLGRYITITSTVYTDAGYTDIATNYGREEREYLVQVRRSNYASGGGYSGLTKKDLEKIAELLAAKLAELPKVELEGIESALARIEARKEADLTPHFAGLLEHITGGHTALAGAIAAIEMPEIPETDLGPVLDRLEDIVEGLSEFGDALSAAGDSRSKELSRLIGTDIERLRAEIARLPEIISSSLDASDASEVLQRSIETASVALGRLKPAKKHDHSDRAKKLIAH